MIKTFCTTLLFLTFALQGFSQGTWENLFNGKNLKGWKKLNGTAEYVIKDGSIIGTTKMGTPNTFLATEKNYSDFILEFEFKVENDLNSGVQFRGQSRADYMNNRVHGYQFEIDPSARAWTGGIYDEARRGWLYAMDRNPAAKSAFKANQWNQARLEVIGNSIRTWINGIPCSNVIDDKDATGFIALQVHAIKSESQVGQTVEWKNIRICTTDLDKMRTPDWRNIPQANHIDNTLSAREQEDGWGLLWDGKTTNGWRAAKGASFPAKGWEIKDGAFNVLASGGGESKNGGDIVTTKKYKNFELTVDFKVGEGANGGVKYFVNTDLNKGEGSSIGCEFQILDDVNHADAKLGVNGNRKLGSLYDLIPAPEVKGFRKGYFNTARIVVNGNKVTHYLNDIKIVEYERNTQMWNALVAYSKYKVWENFGNAEEGNILLQDHGSDVMYKNIKIRQF